ncbi:hypothetical protein MNAN1_000592 [Malassezia nana]|uniref:Uncharacterized protein n=1 Tax=Malassezia nana TaxID=180528 RepID=A0AAF0J168_9BASI|nr:hypothetical protein MNAN1_000592 [Malassezia nana]
MDPPRTQPLRSRRYGTLIEPSPQGTRSAVDNLGSSMAEPPPDAFAVPTSRQAQTLLNAMDARAQEDEAAWTDSDPDMPVIRDLLKEGAVPRSFLSEMQEQDERPWLEALQEEFPNIRRVPVPTVDDEEDEEAPSTVPSAPRVRTVLQAMSGGEPDNEPEIPVTDAAAAAMERLTHDDDAPVTTERRKKTRKPREVGPDGELVRKKKKKDSVRKKKRRSEVDPAVDLRHEPLADLSQGLHSIDEPAESEWGAPMPFLDAVRPADTDLTRPLSPRVETLPSQVGPSPPQVGPLPPSPTRSLVLTEVPRMTDSTPEQNRARVLHYNASRIVVNMLVIYYGMWVMLRRLWRWEHPWITGAVAALYFMVWWRGDLLAVAFLFAFVYVATFRFWQQPATEQTAQGAPSTAVLRHSEALGLVAMRPSREMMQQVSDQVLVVTHGLADMHERMKNLLLWRSPMMTLRYLGWLLLLGLLSMQVTSWMLLRLPGALLFVLVFIVAPLIEHGHWHKFVELLCDITGLARPPPTMPYATTRTLLDSVLAGVPTDEEFLHQKLMRTHWEAERELRRRGQWVEPLNRIVEEIDVHRASLSGHAVEPVLYAQRETHTHVSMPPMPNESGREGESMPWHSTVRASSVEPLRAPPVEVPARAVEEDQQSTSDYGSQVAAWDTLVDDPQPSAAAFPVNPTTATSPMAPPASTAVAGASPAPEPVPLSVPLSPEVPEGLHVEQVQPLSTVASPPLTSPYVAPLSPAPARSPLPPVTSVLPMQGADALGPISPRVESLPLSPVAHATSEMPSSLARLGSPSLSRRTSQTFASGASEHEAQADMPMHRPLDTLARDDGVYLAVYRKRLGHLLVLPTRIAFLLSYSPRQPDTVPGLTTSQILSLSRMVDGRMFYPTMAPRAVMALVRDEMQGRGLATLVPARVPPSRSPAPNEVLFEVPLSHVTGLKKLRKALPLLDDCHEGLELVLGTGQARAGP